MAMAIPRTAIQRARNRRATDQTNQDKALSQYILRKRLFLGDLQLSHALMIDCAYRNHQKYGFMQVDQQHLPGAPRQFGYGKPWAFLLIIAAGIAYYDLVLNSWDWQDDVNCAAFYTWSPQDATAQDNASTRIARALESASENHHPPSEVPLRRQVHQIIEELKSPTPSRSDREDRLADLKKSCD
ncbi:MAG: hypothetical protein RIB30_15590 [Thalassospira sp.]|uniref:hypothetical protein n=1 Tax=Thalassospira sp. TaxID=1912094 RepID=UPI0032F05F59